MDRKKPSVPSDGRAKEMSEVRNKRKSMTCPEEEAYVDMLRTSHLLSRGLRFTPQFHRLRIDVFFEVPTLQAGARFIGRSKVLPLSHFGRA